MAAMAKFGTEIIKNETVRPPNV